MPKNRIAFYTQEGRLQSYNINFNNYTNNLPVNTLTTIFTGDIATAGPEGSRLYDIKVNTPVSIFKTGAAGNFDATFFTLRYVSGNENILLKSLPCKHATFETFINSLISDWDTQLPTLIDPKGNKYINLPAGSKIIISCVSITFDQFLNFSFGKADDNHPWAYKILSYLEDY